MRYPLLSGFLSLALAALGAPSGANVPPPSEGCGGQTCAVRTVYFGTHGEKPGQGIFGAHFDERTGALTPLGEVAQVFRPTWLTADPQHSVLYAVSESGNDGKSNGQVLSFAVGADGSLQRLSEQDSGGGGPTHLAFDALSRSLFVANFGSGTVSVLPADASGHLGAVAARAQDFGTGPNRRQSGPHAHGVTVDPTGRYVLVPDLGADRTFVYRFDAAAHTLVSAKQPYAQVPPGTGPRHIAFGRNGRFAYLATELTAQVITYRWDSAIGGLTPLQTLELMAPGAKGQRSAAEIEVSEDGRFLYVSTREGEDAIYVLAIDPRKGTLSPVQRFETGKRPWSFSLSPSENWVLVAEEGASHVSVLARDPKTGKLSATGHGIQVYEPVNVTFVR